MLWRGANWEVEMMEMALTVASVVMRKEVGARHQEHYNDHNPTLERSKSR